MAYIKRDNSSLYVSTKDQNEIKKQKNEIRIAKKKKRRRKLREGRNWKNSKNCQ